MLGEFYKTIKEDSHRHHNKIVYRKSEIDDFRQGVNVKALSNINL